MFLDIYTDKFLYCKLIGPLVAIPCGRGLVGLKLPPSISAPLDLKSTPGGGKKLEIPFDLSNSEHSRLLSYLASVVNSFVNLLFLALKAFRA